MEYNKEVTVGSILVNILAVILIFILTVSLLVSLMTGIFIRSGSIPEAVSVVHLEDIKVNDQPLAKFILDTYVQDDRVDELNIERILKQGTFRQATADKLREYNDYLTGKTNTLPEFKADDVIEVLRENQDLIRSETGLEVLAADEDELRDELRGPLSDLNYAMEESIGSSSGVLVRTAAQWGWIVFAALLLLLLILLILFNVATKRQLGGVFILFGITALVPSLLLFLAGLGSVIAVRTDQLHFLSDAVTVLQETPLLVGGIASLSGIVLILFGVLWNAITGKKRTAPADNGVYEDPSLYNPSQPTSSADAYYQQTAYQYLQEQPASADPYADTQDNSGYAPDAPVIRRYCRFCGQPLVNTDAKFCYKCGKVQEPTE